MKNELLLKIKPEQRQKLVLTQKMKQIFHVLELPVLELKEYVDSEIEQNPLLEKKERERDFINKNTYNDEILNSLAKKKSLFAHLMEQAHEIFSTKEELAIAEALFSNLNHKGFLAISTSELSAYLQITEEKLLEVLKRVQTFDPIGICAKNIQECLLLQLKEQKKENSLIFELVDKHFEAFLQGKNNFLLKTLKISSKKLKEMTHELKSLKLDPASDYGDEIASPPAPDIRIRYERPTWRVFINHSEIPSFSINALENISFDKEDKKYIQSCILKGKWLKESLENRRKILLKITFFIIKKQKDFLLSAGPLQPLNLKEIALDLKMHSSSISRAVSNKYIDSPLGILPLKYFFSSALSNISNKTALDVLKKLIDEEDKNAPFSDDILCKKLLEKGITIARRTISKYRKKLLIAPAKNRKVN